MEEREEPVSALPPPPAFDHNLALAADVPSLQHNCRAGEGEGGRVL